MGIKLKEALIKARQLLCFEAAIRYGSITQAAQKSFMKQSNLSVQIKELEDCVGEKLLTRIHNGVKLTEAGKEIYPIACDLYNILNKTNRMSLKSVQMSGAIRLWTSDGLAASYVSECFPEFYLSYPNVKIDVTCSLDMPQPELFDMAVVYDLPTDSSWKVIGKYTLKFGLFASKEYLSRFGYPKSIKDIQENHRICTRENYAEVWDKWKEFLDGSQNVCSTTNSSSMLLNLIKCGIGIGLLPLGTAQEENNLTHLSKIRLSLKHQFWLVVRSDVQNMDKVKALTGFIDHTSQKL